MVNQSNYGEKYLSVRYNDLLGPMIKAIQELSHENDLLKRKVKKIELRENQFQMFNKCLQSLGVDLSPSD